MSSQSLAKAPSIEFVARGTPVLSMAYSVAESPESLWIHNQFSVAIRPDASVMASCFTLPCRLMTPVGQGSATATCKNDKSPISIMCTSK